VHVTKARQVRWRARADGASPEQPVCPARHVVWHGLGRQVGRCRWVRLARSQPPRL